MRILIDLSPSPDGKLNFGTPLFGRGVERHGGASANVPEVALRRGCLHRAEVDLRRLPRPASLVPRQNRLSPFAQQRHRDSSGNGKDIPSASAAGQRGGEKE